MLHYELMRPQKYKIVFCTPAIYSAGGIERVVSCKANYFADVFGYDVTIIVTEGMGDVSFFPLSREVKVVNLGLDFEELWHKPFWKKILLYLKKQHRYKCALRKELIDIRPDIVVSTLRREVNFINNIKDGSIKIGELHLSRSNYRGQEASATSIAKYLFSKWWKGDIVDIIRQFDRFVVLTASAAEEWPELKNVTIIPDPLTLNVTDKSNREIKRVIAVGRYSYEKGYDMLLRIWSIVEKRCTDWHLDVFGMGDPTPYVKMMTELSIDKSRCHLNASLADVSKEYVRSSILVQPSRFEGFGLVVVEAMAFGLPVVAFDCENGPRTILSDGVEGFLIPTFDEEMFAKRIVDLANDIQTRVQMGDAGRIQSVRYHIDKVAILWKQLFDELMNGR